MTFLSSIREDPEKYPRATYVVFDRAGHLLEDKQDLIDVLMNEWLDRVEEYVAQSRSS